MTRTHNCIICEKEINDNTPDAIYITDIEEYCCSEECLNKWHASKIEEDGEEPSLKDEFNKQLREEILPNIAGLAELIVENKEEIIETALPILMLYRDVIRTTIMEFYDIKTEAIINQMTTLEKQGFSTDQAIELLKIK
jgi:hypothetical protein